MPWFIILSLAIAVAAAGMVAVAVVSLVRSVKALTEAARQASARLAPLTEELRSEQAVTQLELDALQRRRRELDRRDRPGVRYP